MPAERFYFNGELRGVLTLDGTEFHHLAHVMKIRPGEQVELVNGRGALAIVEVASVEKREATLKILSVSTTPLSPPSRILAIPLIRPSKLEFIIEKCTELGADAFWLYPADKDALSPHQFERLSHIAISAMKQCGRLDLPEIKVLSCFEEIFNAPYTYLFGDTRPEAKPLKAEEKTVFITGPEGGFSDKELTALDAKAQGVRLHKNILRAETAPIAAICITTHLEQKMRATHRF